MDSDIAQSLAKGFGLDREQIEDLGKSLEKVAITEGWPEVNPLAQFLFQVGEVEIGWAFQGWMATNQIKKIVQERTEQEPKAPEKPAAPSVPMEGGIVL